MFSETGGKSKNLKKNKIICKEEKETENDTALLSESMEPEIELSSEDDVVNFDLRLQKIAV